MFLLFHAEYQPLPPLAHVRAPFVTIVEKGKMKHHLWIKISIKTDCQWVCVTYKQSAFFKPPFDAWLMWKLGLCLVFSILYRAI